MTTIATTLIKPGNRVHVVNFIDFTAFAVMEAVLEGTQQLCRLVHDETYRYFLFEIEGHGGERVAFLSTEGGFFPPHETNSKTGVPPMLILHNYFRKSKECYKYLFEIEHNRERGTVQTDPEQERGYHLFVSQKVVVTNVMVLYNGDSDLWSDKLLPEDQLFVVILEADPTCGYNTPERIGGLVFFSKDEDARESMPHTAWDGILFGKDLEIQVTES